MIAIPGGIDRAIGGNQHNAEMLGIGGCQLGNVAGNMAIVQRGEACMQIANIG